MANFNMDAGSSPANKSAKEATKRNAKNYNEEIASEFTSGTKGSKPEDYAINKEHMATVRKKPQQ